MTHRPFDFNEKIILLLIFCTGLVKASKAEEPVPRCRYPLQKVKPSFLFLRLYLGSFYGTRKAA